ncbi:unnamed protein product [Cuscuta epithymum]|uniref:CCHC-type domain-containing protein n=1 Tax=Cuscuta epithymum TaxID=186058 RepID=A0AAV0C3C5_9ASTE|nr:unnamed protein product [Cuscuta epithymum]
MRIRVCLDVEKSLKVGTTLRKGQGEGHWVDFKYEKLPIFCFSCGIIGHVGRFCPLVYENIYVDTNQQYGVSLRAGGGGKACWGGDKWLVPEGSRDGSMAVREDGERAGPSRQGWELSLAGNIKSRTEDEETTVVDGTSGDPKRRRTWEEDSGERDEGKTWPWTTQKPERGRV